MATREEVHQAILRAGQAGDGEAVRTLGAYLKTMPQGFEPTPPPPEQQGAFSSGIASYLPQLQETYGGVKTLLGVGAERMLGEGDISKGLISSGARSIQEANAAQAPLVTPERASFTSALDKGAGSVFTEYLPYQIGSGVTNLLESLAVMGAGSVLGSAVPGAGTAAGAVTGLVSKELVKRGVKEAAEAILKERGEQAAKEFVEQQTKSAAASVAAKMGATTALAGQAGFYGAGQTTNRAVEEAQKMGGSATDIELARVLPAAAVATVAEFIGDKIAVGALKGAGAASPNFVTNIAKQILLTGTKEAPVEIIQQTAERYGAKLSLADAEAIKEYIDSAAGAYAMSVVPGGIGGVRGSLQARSEVTEPEVVPEIPSAVPEIPPVVPEVPPVVPPAAEQVLPRVEDITGVTRAAPPSAQESAEVFDPLRIQRIDADAQRIAEINRRQGIASPARQKGVITERPSMAEAAPELTSQEDLLAKQAEVDARRLEAGMSTGTSSMTPGVQPTPPVVEEPKPVPKIVDNRPLTDKAAKNRLLVMSNMLKNQGGDPASLTIVPHPSVANKFAIQSLDVPVKFTKNLPTTPSDRPVTPPIVDPVNAYVEVQRRTNTPAARRFVSDFESGNITREDVQTAIAAERKAAEPPLVVLPQGEIVSAPTNKTRAEPTSFQIDLKQKAEGNQPFAIVQFPQDGKNVYYASPEQTLEASQRTELALTQQEQKTADAIQARLDAATTQEERTASEAALQSALRKATVRALADVKSPVKPEVTTEEPPTETPPGEAPPTATTQPQTLQEFEARMPIAFDKAEVRAANVAGNFTQLTTALQLSKNPTIRRIGELGAGIASKITLRKPGRIAGHPDAAGVYRYADDSIQMIPSYAGDEHTNAHETVHALISKAQRNPTDRQKPVAAEIKKLYKYVQQELQRKGLDNFYGLTNEREFTAEAMTNPRFQFELMQIPYPGKKNAWTKFTQLVADLLGIQNTNALTEVLNLVDRLAMQKQPRKKITDKNLVDASEQPDTRKSLGAQRSKLGLYSELENKIQAGSPKAPAASWKAYINGLTQKGVKPEEIEWSGVRDWLDLQKGTVLKEDLLNYLKEGGVQVEETVMSDDDVNYDEYTLPGGKNYREVVLTLPEKKPSISTVGWTAKLRLAKSPITSKPEFEIRDQDGTLVNVIHTAEDSQKAINTAARLLYEKKNRSANYKSKHWDQPNVIAHLRINDRTDADGKKVLFVEEIQSDWGQEGKKKGFAKTLTKEDLVPKINNSASKPYWEVRTTNGVFVANVGIGDEEISESQAVDEAYELVEKRGIFNVVPSGPFVTKTEGWLNLALKRVMIMASEEGYDRVAFVNGEQSAERYDLSKQVDFVSMQKMGDQYSISAYKDDKEIASHKAKNENEAADVVGKEIAAKLFKEIENPRNGGRAEVSGDGLKVGGEGMKTFYDTIVPTALKKLLPKVGGGQMGKVQIDRGATESTYDQIKPFLAWMKENHPGYTAAESSRMWSMGPKNNALVQEFEAQRKTLGQPGFDVTPEMQEKVATTGLPMFSKKGERTQQLQDFENTLRAQLKKFGLSDVGLKIEAGMNDAGSYAQQLIRIAADSAQPIRTLRHESVHALREMGFFTDAQWKSLSKMAKDQWIDQYLKQRNVDGKPLKSGEESRYDAYVREYKGDAEKITEEAVADAFADFDATKPPAGLVQAILKRLQNLFQSIKTALTNVESPEQIFGKVEKGELKAGAREAATEAKSLREKATDNFMRWFGDSKVVDEKGEPLVVYHATGSDIKEFDVSKIKRPYFGYGFHTAESPTLANFYADQHNEGQNIMPLYLHITNPFVMKSMTDWYSLPGNTDFERTELLKKQGFDGIKYPHGAPYNAPHESGTGWVAFEPTQIKSAIGNNGDYSLTNADISKSLRGVIKEATDNFKKWFKNSKVTDDDGEPKVMYHATPEDFTEFKPGGKDETLSGPAIWLSPYADKQPAAHNIGRTKGKYREGTNVMPVYVRMERPLLIDDMTMLEWARSVYGNSEFPQLISKKAVADMKEDGYDGIQFDGEALGWGDRSGETIVFDANQIKSAIGNNGEYSLTDNDIRKSLGGTKAVEVSKEDTKKFWQGAANIERTEGVEAAETAWIGGVADFGDREAAKDIQLMRGYRDYHGQLIDLAQEHLAGNKGKVFGNKFIVYRYGDLRFKDEVAFNATADRAEYEGALDPKATTLSINFAKKFKHFAGFDEDRDPDATMGWMRIAVDPEAIVMVGKQSENEIVIDPNFLGPEDIEIIDESFEPSKPEARFSLRSQPSTTATAAERLRKAGQEAYQKRQPLDSGAFKGVPEDLFNKLGGVFAPRNETVLDRIEGMKENFWQRVAQGVADQYRTIKEYSEDAYMKARMSKTIDGGLEGLMFHGHVFNDGGALNIRKNTKGMLEVLKPVGKELDRYLIWVALSRDSTMPTDKRSIADDLVSRRAELVEGTIDGQPRLEVYQKVQKEMNAINRSVLKVAVDAGLLNTTEGAIKDIRSNDKLTDKEKADQIAELVANPIGYEKFINDLNYIPFYKVMEDGDTQNVSTASGLTSQYFSKALKGGEKPFGDLMENTLRNWSHILSASMKNQAAVATIDAAIKHNAAAPNLKVGFEMRDGLIYSIKSDKMVGDGSLRPEFTENEKGAVKVMMDGKPTYYKVTDPLLMDAIAAIGYMGPQSKFLDVAKDFKNILQYGVTISPAFKVNNLIRDSVSAMGVSELKKNPIANVIQGISLSDKNSETYIAGLAGGAIFNFGSAYEGDQSRLIKRLVKQGVERDSILDTKQRIAKGLRYSWDKYNEWGNKSESANRLALYKQLRDAGMSHLEASFKARDLLDFSMQGSWPAFRFLTQTIPFLNARVQGLYKLGKDGIIPTYRVLHNTMTGEDITGSDKQKAQSFAIVASAVGLASAVLYLAFKDDEDFKKRDEWDRDNFWWIKVPGMDYALRIPKPFEIGAIGTLIERTLEQIFDSGAEGKQFTDSIFRTLSNTFALNPMPQMFKPVLDLYANKDSFTGAPIESAGLEKLSKQERKIDTTSPLAVAAGAFSTVLPESLELSPVQVDYLIKGYFGWLGATASSISIGAVAPFKDGEYPDVRWMDKAALGLVKELPTNQSKYVTAFYESNKEISQAFADMRHYQNIGDSDKALEIFKEQGDLIALAKMYDNISTQMGKMRTQIKIVTNDPEMDGTAKAEAIDRMKMMIGQMAQQAEDIRKSMKP